MSNFFIFLNPNLKGKEEVTHSTFLHNRCTEWSERISTIQVIQMEYREVLGDHNWLGAAMRAFEGIGWMLWRHIQYIIQSKLSVLSRYYIESCNCNIESHFDQVDLVVYIIENGLVVSNLT